MAGPFGDDFTEASDTNLGSHTPTGSNHGSGWTVNIGAMIVKSADGEAADNNASAGNRATLNDSIGSDQMDIEADCHFTSLAGPGSGFAVGISGRAAAANQNGAYEFIYALSIGGTGGWDLNGTQVTEAWPEAFLTLPAHLKLEIRNNSIKGYADGVLKITLTNNLGVGNNFGGIVALNFNGVGNETATRVDNFVLTNMAPIEKTPYTNVPLLGPILAQ
jgi:hypothetical protein